MITTHLTVEGIFAMLLSEELTRAQQDEQNENVQPYPALDDIRQLYRVMAGFLSSVEQRKPDPHNDTPARAMDHELAGTSNLPVTLLGEHHRRDHNDN